MERLIQNLRIFPLLIQHLQIQELNRHHILLSHHHLSISLFRGMLPGKGRYSALWHVCAEVELTKASKQGKRSNVRLSILLIFVILAHFLSAQLGGVAELSFCPKIFRSIYF